MFFLSFPANIDSVGCGPERRKTWRGNVFRLIQDPRATPSFEKSRQRVKSIRCKCESPIRVPEMQSFSVRAHNETFAFAINVLWVLRVLNRTTAITYQAKPYIKIRRCPTRQIRTISVKSISD